MRDLPTKVIIFGRVFKVTVEELPDDLAGDCDPDLEIIRISSSEKQKTRTHTFLHEFLHAVVYRTGLFQGLNEDLIEVIVENIATAILENFTLSKKRKK